MRQGLIETFESICHSVLDDTNTSINNNNIYKKIYQKHLLILVTTYWLALDGLFSSAKTVFSYQCTQFQIVRLIFFKHELYANVNLLKVSCCIWH
jgi:hypothetical protein